MSETVMVVLIGLGVALIAAGLFLTWRRSSVRPAVQASPLQSRRPMSIGDELQAAPASETVEDLVNQRLSSLPELAGTRVDFGTAADGSLEIWVGDRRYTSVEDIADSRVRQAVLDAVASYNN